MIGREIGFLGAAAMALLSAPVVAQKVFRSATTGDVLGLDRHVNNEGPTNETPQPLTAGSSEARWHAVGAGRLGEQAIRRELS